MAAAGIDDLVEHSAEFFGAPGLAHDPVSTDSTFERRPPPGLTAILPRVGIGQHADERLGQAGSMTTTFPVVIVRNRLHMGLRSLVRTWVWTQTEPAARAARP